MNRFHTLLLASAMLLSVGSNVVLAQFPGDYVYDYDYDYYPSDKDNDYIEINKRFLTPGERGQVATIHARAEKREEQWEARERARYKKEAEEKAERESIRRSQCMIPFLWIGCPPESAKAK
jgi:hypothetical protein